MIQNGLSFRIMRKKGQIVATQVLIINLQKITNPLRLK